LTRIVQPAELAARTGDAQSAAREEQRQAERLAGSKLQFRLQRRFWWWRRLRSYLLLAWALRGSYYAKFGNVGAQYFRSAQRSTPIPFVIESTLGDYAARLAGPVVALGSLTVTVSTTTNANILAIHAKAASVRDLSL